MNEEVAQMFVSKTEEALVESGSLDANDYNVFPLMEFFLGSALRHVKNAVDARSFDESLDLYSSMIAHQRTIPASAEQEEATRALWSAIEDKNIGQTALARLVANIRLHLGQDVANQMQDADGMFQAVPMDGYRGAIGLHPRVLNTQAEFPTLAHECAHAISFLRNGAFMNVYTRASADRQKFSFMDEVVAEMTAGIVCLSLGGGGGAAFLTTISLYLAQHIYALGPQFLLEGLGLVRVLMEAARCANEILHMLDDAGIAIKTERLSQELDLIAA